MSNIIRVILLMSTLVWGVGFNSSVIKQKFLKPEEAFMVSAIKENSMIVVTIKLGEKIHIYRDSLHFKVISPKEIELDSIALPKATKLDEDMVYEHRVDVNISEDGIKIKGEYTLSVEFEGCSDSGICYQPQKQTFLFSNGEVATQSTPNKSVDMGADDGILTKIGSLADEANSAKIADVLQSESSFFIILLFFIFGLLLSLTPCIFPMIPILSSIIVSQSNDGKTSTTRAFLTSLIYVLSMAITYTIVGLIAGLMGADIQSAMQNPWVLTIFAGMFVALAFSLFGYYEIALPSSIQSKLTRASDNAQGKGVMGTVIMGFLSALIVGPCVAPPLGGAILFISHTGDALLGGMALFVMSMGMGMPLLLVGIGAGKFMPRPGGWMTKVSQIFGLMMLGLAIFMLARILPDNLTLILWSMLTIGISLYMGLLNGESPIGMNGYMSKLFAILFLVYGIALFIGGISGSSSIFRPFERFTNANGEVVKQVLTTVTKSHLGYSIERLQNEVKASTKPVVVDFGKDSCTACLELEEITFPNPLVQAELKNFTFIKVDLTANSDDDKALLKKYELFGTPNIIFFDKDNSYLADKSLTGFIKPEDFANHLKSISH
jgi:thiol:disulfide interchange protein DsbD